MAVALESEPVAPPISVVIPVRNDPDHLTECLQGIANSRGAEYEVIVVDDASTTSESIEVAKQFGARVVRLPTQGGPGLARNRGVSEASHEIVFFVDADVCVQPDSLAQVADTFANDPSIDAVFGSYDTEPTAGNVLSQYRNLMHHYVHQASSTEAWTFWSGCGAVRRDVFLELGGFSSSYRRPSIEDIEFGGRLSAAGHRVVLLKTLQVTHLKRWSTVSMIRCDVRDRAVPWTTLLLESKRLPNDLNLKHTQRLSALLSFALVGVLAIGSFYLKSLLLVPVLAVLGYLAIDRWTQNRRVPDAVRVLAVIVAGATLVTMAVLSLSHGLWQLWLLAIFGLVAGIFALNLDFYLFFVRLKGWLFVPIVVPLHILFFVYSSLAFAVGCGLHLLRGNRGASAEETRESDLSV